jgi:colanic acid/amylovoran biosynthesis glycosyltransferase
VNRLRSGRPLHLVEVGVHWPPETFLRRKLEGLAERGMRVTVAASLVFDEEVELSGVELRRMPLSARGPGAAAAWRAAAALLFRSPRRLLRLLRNIKRVPPELARRHGGTRGLLRMCLPLARLRPDVVQFEWNIAAVDHLPLFGVWSCPVLTACRGSDVTVYPHVAHLRPYAERLPEVMRQATVVHCVSEALVREAGDFGLDPAKARVIRPAVDPQAFMPQSPNGGPAGDALRILMVGGLRWEKGHEYALEAIRRLTDDGVRVQFELVGDPPESAITTSGERARILHTVDDLGLEAHVTLRGGAGPDRVCRLLAGSDVLLHASVAEGIPNVVLEAMACGIPVVATDVGGVSEVVTDGVEGFVVGPRDPAGLAQALRRLAGDPSLRARMGVAGRERIERDFTLDAQLDDLLAMYREVAG